MGKLSLTNPTSSPARRFVAAFFFLWSLAGAVLSAQSRATAVPLLLPTGIAFDQSGNLYVVQQSGHQVLLVSPAGVLTRYAGTGVQGFAGDGGPALAAELDSPAAIAVSPSGDLYVADTHNHRIRRVNVLSGTISTVAGTGVPGAGPDGAVAGSSPVDSPVSLAFDSAGNLFFADARTHRVRRVDRSSGLLSTVAGSGVQGFSGDGGPATAASLDSPAGLAVDASGAIFIADSHNGRIRRVDPATHLIATVAGTGLAGSAGDGGAAAQATLRLPRGLTIDSAGNLYLADATGQRVRRIDGATGTISTVAGGVIQRFAGDGGPAVSASLDTPAAVGVRPSGLVTLADSGNQRVRQIDAAGVIHTIAGLGQTDGSALALSAPSTISYGTGTLTATLSSSPATGFVTLLELSGTQLSTIGVQNLASNAAVFSTGSLPAGTHLLQATYGGDSLHAGAQSQVFSLVVAPAALVATSPGAAIEYGQPIPALTATLNGLLPADTTLVSLTLASAATSSSAPGSYPITASLGGPAAANYTLSLAPAVVAIAKAPVSIQLSTSNALSARVASTTTGTPAGQVALLNGSQVVATAPLAAGFAVFTPALATGTYTLTAQYAGDTDFLPATSQPAQFTVNPGPDPDFSIRPVGLTSQTISAGTAAAFSFAATLTNGGPPSAIQLAVAGLPPGATASFNPAYLPPGGTVSSTILTIQTPHAQLELERRGPWGLWLAVLVPLAFVRRQTAIRKFSLFLLAAGLLLSTVACGDRVSTAGQAAPIKTYTLMVTGTATGASGAVLQHTSTVTLNVQ